MVLLNYLKTVKAWTFNCSPVFAEVRISQRGFMFIAHKKMKSHLLITALLTSSCSLGPKIDELDVQANSSDAIATAESAKLMDKVESRLSVQTNSMDATFENARRQFSEKDADVIIKGDQLILRLKGLHFENNQASIGSKNYQLLTKVQSVLRSVKSSQIQIEGHADSIESKKNNKALSMKRAEAVQNYLVANNNLNSGQIVALGLGDTQPIATNKTFSGRALNRRVDIIINSTSVE